MQGQDGPLAIYEFYRQLKENGVKAGLLWGKSMVIGAGGAEEEISCT